MFMDSPRLKINIIGIFIIISTILTTISVFTKYWIVYDSPLFGIVSHIGIVPYHWGTVGWFDAGSILMFISLGLFGPLILTFLFCWFKTQNQDCYHNIRSSFHLISLLCSTITFFEIVAFVLFACNSFHHYGAQNEELGSSAYCAVASAICLGIPVAFSSHISRNDCH